MENQHRKIKGYRELGKEEIKLMNLIKEKGSELLELQKQLQARLDTDLETKIAEARKSMDGSTFNGKPYDENTGASDECNEYRRFIAAEPHRWVSIGKTDIQTGVMALVRAIAQPSDN